MGLKSTAERTLSPHPVPPGHLTPAYPTSKQGTKPKATNSNEGLTQYGYKNTVSNEARKTGFEVHTGGWGILYRMASPVGCAREIHRKSFLNETV